MEKISTHFSMKQKEEEEASFLFRLWLQNQFSERCKKNGKYSLRAFALHLNLDASSLSQILSGKRNISKTKKLLICEKLSITPQELQLFGLVYISQPSAKITNNYFQIDLDTFSVISDWYHYAILELTYVSGFKSDAKWIAKALSVSVLEVKNAIERLKRLGLLIEENNSLIKSNKQITNHANVTTSHAHKELQKQIITKALNAVDETPMDQKDITSMTMSIDPKNLEKARILIAKFRRELCELLEDGCQEQVYNLAIQLYPISNLNKGIKNENIA